MVEGFGDEGDGGDVLFVEDVGVEGGHGMGLQVDETGLAAHFLCWFAVVSELNLALG